MMINVFLKVFLEESFENEEDGFRRRILPSRPVTEETASSTSVSSFAPTTSASLDVAEEVELSSSSPPELSSTTTACSFSPVAAASASLTRTYVSTGTKRK